MNSHPIGIFDSGVGGTSIWKEIVRKLPNENTIYIADSLHAPYGEKTSEEIIELSKNNAEFLIDKGCKLIVVACNTATTNAIKYLRGTFEIPFIGIEPAIKPAAIQSKSGAIGILATKGTLSSSLFEETSKRYTQHIKVVEKEGTGLVPLIEKGDMESTEIKQLLHTYLHPMVENGIDHLVLGCSHYPYLIPTIKEIIGNQITIIDSGEAVAKQTHHVLSKENLLNISNTLGTHTFYTNGDADVLKKFISKEKIPTQIIQF